MIEIRLLYIRLGLEQQRGECAGTPNHDAYSWLFSSSIGLLLAGDGNLIF